MARANFIRLTYEAPPWAADPSSFDNWVRLPTAGELYFRRSYKAIRAMLERHEFDDIFQTYFDGSRWWIKLPVSLRALEESRNERAAKIPKTPPSPL